MRTFTINGSKFHNPESFHKHVASIFDGGSSGAIGKNLEAFAELLEGGFRQHDYLERIEVRWINMAKSRARLSPAFYQAVLETIEEAETVDFIRVEFGR